MASHKYAQIGSVISGTMITEDVFNACISALEDLDAKRAKGIRASWDRVEENCPSVDDDHDTDDCDSCNEARSSILNEDLWNALDEHCPPYVYFGANEGDGCDYGFWPLIDSLEEAVYCGEVLKVSDTSEIPSYYRGYVMAVNDHGNVTLYDQTARKRIGIWNCA